MEDSSKAGGEKPRIIIDEDWKTQVQAEKEALKQKAEEAPGGNPRAPASEPIKPQSEEAGPLPPATLAALVTMLATQALVCLGQIPNPVTHQPELRLDEAKHFVDLLEMLETKTAGNRTPEENQLFENLLHQLRLGYVSAKK